jgi:hypothetical protein
MREIPANMMMDGHSIQYFGGESKLLLHKKISTMNERSLLRKVDREPQSGRCYFMIHVCQAFLALVLVVGVWKLSDSQVPPDGDGGAGVIAQFPAEGFPKCEGRSCFTQARVRVDPDRPGFPSFWKYANRGPLHVTADRRSLKINGDRALFIGGSMHPVRATQLTWNYALDEAVRNGLNMITIYVIWAAHQPFPDKEIDWSLPGSVACGSLSSRTPSCDWNLASAIRAAGDRGIFVHIRLGPYDCAEYSYGGIPEWVALHSPDIAMRRPNRQWLDAMKAFIESAVSYLTENGLWAYQGGPILMSQIENELGGDVDPVSEHLLSVDDTGHFVDPGSPNAVRNATLQDYADWCGLLAEELAPNVVWTMCNGLSAYNTITTCNGISECTPWLEQHGDSGRIQVDQPALLTEFEGGFQVWGETPQHPTDYFWGRTARAMSRDALKWFARGGTHLNYYMWYGGYNRGRAAGAGIANWYASDAVLCPSGQRHQPKFGHFEALHEALSGVALTLLNAHSALNASKPVEHLDDNGKWQTGPDQRMFEYKVTGKGFKHVVFVENDAKFTVFLRLPGTGEIFPMKPESAIILADGLIRFDSASVDPFSMAFERKFAETPAIPSLLDWSVWQEPIGAPSEDPRTVSNSVPLEQTELNIDSKVYSDYAWYETDIFIDSSVGQSTLFIDTQKASAFSVYIDNLLVGGVDHHLKSEGPITLQVDAGSLSEGKHTLSLLSESLGYNNLIGRWGGSTWAKTKGITGDVVLSLGKQGANVSLVDGRDWRSSPGLHGESSSKINVVRRAHLERNIESRTSSSPTWASALFDTPRHDPTLQALFLEITAGRGHLWLNGKDLGRYWNITRAGTEDYSQPYYLLPDDYLYTDGRLNEIILFDTVEGSQGSVKLVLSWIESTPSDSENFMDEVDYPLACI